MHITDLPTLNAILNGLCALLLLLGYIQIKQGNIQRHQKCMVGALVTSVFFLTSYVIYHIQVGSVPYPHHNWTRSVYFAILIPHIILAVVNVPFIILLVWRALQGNFERHKKLARYVWPSWMFVSITGVVIYLMLYQL
ncbi:MAG: putative membrane protein [Candidatus Latescibacterota bacterium]|jgi:putative membrane protein